MALNSQQAQDEPLQVQVQAGQNEHIVEEGQGQHVAQDAPPADDMQSEKDEEDAQGEDVSLVGLDEVHGRQNEEDPHIVLHDKTGYASQEGQDGHETNGGQHGLVIQGRGEDDRAGGSLLGDGSLLASLRLQIRDYWKTLLFHGTPAVTLVTPSGASAAYFVTTAVWDALYERGRSITSHDIHAQIDVVALLFRNAHYNDQRLQESLRAGARNDRTLARQAFQDVLHRTSNSEFMNNFLQLIVADRMAWALSKPDGPDCRPAPLSHLKTQPSDAESKADRVIEMHTKWDSTLRNFAYHWEKSAKEQSPSRQRLVPPTVRSSHSGAADVVEAEEVPGISEPATDVSHSSVVKASSAVLGNLESQSWTAQMEPMVLRQGRKVLSSLVDGLSESESRVRMAKVEHNFCQAALGLFGLALVRYHCRLLSAGPY